MRKTATTESGDLGGVGVDWYMRERDTGYKSSRGNQKWMVGPLVNDIINKVTDKLYQ